MSLLCGAEARSTSEGIVNGRLPPRASAGGRATQGHAGWRAAVLSHVKYPRGFYEETGAEHSLSRTPAEGEGR
jgi:hypothetical protein